MTLMANDTMTLIISVVSTVLPTGMKSILCAEFTNC